MNIRGLNKAAVLAALYNSAKPLGMGWLHYDSRIMTVEEAEKVIAEYGLSFDYHKGRVMKIDISDDEVDTRLYNRDNGAGAAEAAVDAVGRPERS